MSPGVVMPTLLGVIMLIPNQRSFVPSSLTVDSSSIDTGSLGTPVAEYDSTTCDLSSKFGRESDFPLNREICLRFFLLKGEGRRGYEMERGAGADEIPAQTLTLDITLCGSWAGVPSLLGETCGALVGDATW